MLISQGVE